MDVSDGTWLMPGTRTRCYAETRRLMFCGMRFRRRIAPCAIQLSLSKNIGLTRRAKEAWKKEDEIDYGY